MGLPISEAKPSRSSVIQLFNRPWVLIPIVIAGYAGLRTVIEAYKIPSGSMYPTLEVDDNIYASKVAYGLFKKTVPARGDLVVFRFPYQAAGEEPQLFFKRVIGLPGDQLEVDHGHPVINGWRVPTCSIGRRRVSSELGSNTREMEFFVEFLAESAYLVGIEDSVPEHEGPFLVWPEEIYVFGDNRANSADSRVFRDGKGGGVPLEDLVGRGLFVWFPPGRFGISLKASPRAPRVSPPLDTELAACLAKRPKRADPPPPKPT